MTGDKGSAEISVEFKSATSCSVELDSKSDDGSMKDALENITS